MNIRQSKILDFINSKGSTSRIEIEKFVNSVMDNVSKNTIVRDLTLLLKEGLIKKKGNARNIVYHPSFKNDLFVKYDTEAYFKDSADERLIKYPQFNFEVFDKLKNIFSASEIKKLEAKNAIYCEKIEKLPPALLKKEFERLLIELSWKSSQIEGNTYSLLDTEVLIKQNVEARGHNKEEAIMILNHKNALNYIFENGDYFKTLSLAKIEELHSILTRDLNVARNLRHAPVGIVGTNYKPLFNQMQIKEAIEKTIELINTCKNPIEKALVVTLMLSYIQPFEDGNKRTGRILANAILYANGYCPLSYRSVNEAEYKKAVILFYENNSLEYFKRIFVEQFKFAIDTYF